MVGRIYKIQNVKNGKIYIGKTVQKVRRRFLQHLNNAYNQGKKFKGLHLYEAIRKYGIDNFTVEIVEEVDVEKLNEREQYWIKCFDSSNPKKGYNLTGGGDGAGIMLPCTKKKIIETKRKKGILKISKETREKISMARKGQKFSEEHKKHLSENHHLKTTHILFYKDGHTELSTESIEKIARKLNVTAVRLRRASEVGEFRCGEFYLLDLTDLDLAFNHKYKYSKEKCFIDPVTKEEVTITSLRARHQHHPEIYKEFYSYNNFNEEKIREKKEFIEKYETIKKTALEKEEFNK